MGKGVWASKTPLEQGIRKSREPQDGNQVSEAPEITWAFSGGGLGASLRLSAKNLPNSQERSLSHKGQVLDLILALCPPTEKLRPRDKVGPGPGPLTDLFTKGGVLASPRTPIREPPLLGVSLPAPPPSHCLPSTRPGLAQPTHRG